MDHDEALALLRRLLQGAPVRAELDDLGNLLVFQRRDLTHLEADALNDRLHAWAAREVARSLPHVAAFVSFRHARPATADQAELGLEAEWLDLEPTFRLELSMPPAREADVRAFAARVPEFLAKVDAAGRPAGWRRPDVGNME